MPNIPYFSCDTLAYLSSATINNMTMEEEGIYWRLIVHSWHYKDCTLPDDMRVLRSLVKNSSKKKILKVLNLGFFLTENGWKNERIFQEFLKVLSKSSKAKMAVEIRENNKLVSSNDVSNDISNQNQNQNHNHKKESNTRTKSQTPRFVHPSIEDVKKYCLEKEYFSFDAEKFFAYYESNGWRVGRNPMKSWKAAITTWRKNNFGGNGDGKTRLEQIREIVGVSRPSGSEGISKRSNRTSGGDFKQAIGCLGGSIVDSKIIEVSPEEIE